MGRAQTVTGSARLHTTEEIIADIRAGRMVILMDDADRENEGDLVMAAEHVTAADINFMARYGRGLICLTLTAEHCEQLQLPLMVADNNDKNSTNFTVSIEAAQGVTTGISAADRAATVRAAVRVDARPEDIVMPGHIFPLRAQAGGVMARAGHTEAGCDLARLAGLTPAAVIVEILNEDGSMARQPELLEFAHRHDLKIGTIEDLIRYRSEQERSIEMVAQCSVETRFGPFQLLTYHDQAFDEAHLALVRGTIRADQPTLVRVQSASALRDLLGVSTVGSWSISSALRAIADADNGVLLVMNKTVDAVGIVKEVQDHKIRSLGVKSPKTDDGPDLRQHGVGAQILADIGLGKLRIMGRERRLHSLAGFGLQVVEFLPAPITQPEQMTG